MTRTSMTLITASAFCSMVSAKVLADPSRESPAMGDDYLWQKKRLFNPTPAQRQEEDRGRVFIYHNLKRSDVSKAMDEHFNRIDSMMFTGTVITDDRGAVLRDGNTGEAVVEDDGCDE